MKLSDFATKLVAENHFIKFSIGGFAGSGKTRTASEFAAGIYKDLGLKGPILILDNELSARFLEPFFRTQGIEVIVKDTDTLGDVLTAFDFLEKKEVALVFIDSLTKMWYKFIRDYRANHNNRKMQLNDWGVVIPEWQEKFSDRLVKTKGNIVFTGRGGYEYDLEEVEGSNKKQFVRSGVKMKMQGETAFETDINVWMDSKEEVENGKVVKQWREAFVMKDRSTTIDGKTFVNPTYKDFKPVVDFLKTVPLGSLAGATDTRNLAPSDVSPAKRQERDEALESIQASFDQLGLSTGATDKKLKIDLWEMVFLTNSKSKVENMSLDRLKKSADLLSEYKNRIAILIEEGSKPSEELFKSTLTALMTEYKFHEQKTEA
jgi:hypothetical protein